MSKFCCNCSNLKFEQTRKVNGSNLQGNNVCGIHENPEYEPGQISYVSGCTPMSHKTRYKLCKDVNIDGECVDYIEWVKERDWEPYIFWGVILLGIILILVTNYK